MKHLFVIAAVKRRIECRSLSRGRGLKQSASFASSVCRSSLRRGAWIETIVVPMPLLLHGTSLLSSEGGVGLKPRRRLPLKPSGVAPLFGGGRGLKLSWTGQLAGILELSLLSSEGGVD